MISNTKGGVLIPCLFCPARFKYECDSPSVKKQFDIVKGLLNRPDVDTIYVCTDSGREGEYIYRLVAQMAGVKDKKQKRVWIDSQTEEEILRGIREAKDISEYDNLSASAYLRAKEDYLMGINFSRVLTLRYGNSVSNYLKYKISGYFSRACHDLCSWNGCTQGTGDPFLCKNIFLQCDFYN